MLEENDARTSASAVLSASRAAMRIITWNCQMGLDKKADALLSLNPDIAVVPECSEKSIVALQQRGFCTLWFGSNPNKGMVNLSGGVADSSTPAT